MFKQAPHAHAGRGGVAGRVLAAIGSALSLLCVMAFAMPSAALAEGTQVNVRVPVSVAVTGDQPASAQTFTFVMSQTEDEDLAPAQSTVSVTGEGTAYFDLTLDGVGLHAYTVTQVAGGEAGWTYDTQVYDVRVYAMWDDATQAIRTRVVVEDSQGFKSEGCAFSNAYDDPSQPKPADDTPGTTTGKATTKATPKSGVSSVVSSLRLPQTSDVSSGAWMGMGLVALAAIAVGVVLRRRGSDGREA